MMVRKIATALCGSLLASAALAAVAAPPALAATPGTGVSYSASSKSLTLSGAAGEDNEFDLFSGWFAGVEHTLGNARLVFSEQLSIDSPGIRSSTVPSACSTANIDVTGDSYTNSGWAAGYVGFFSCPQSAVTKVTLDGNDGDDEVIVDSADSSDWGDPFPALVALVINGGAGDDDITGGDGNDKIDAGADWNFVDGGAGNDDITAGSADDLLYGGDGDDKIHAGSGDDDVEGGAGIDSLYGEGGDDVLLAFDLAVDAVVNCGGHTADGGDYAQVDADPADPVSNCEDVDAPPTSNVNVAGGVLHYSALDRTTVTINANDADAVTVTDPSMSGVVAGAGCESTGPVSAECTGVTSIVVDGSDAPDVIKVIGSVPATLNGNADADLLFGGSGVDALHGGAGDDVMRAADGAADTISCGSENDVVYKDDVEDAVDSIAGDCETITHETTTRLRVDGGTLHLTARAAAPITATDAGGKVVNLSSSRGFLTFDFDEDGGCLPLSYTSARCTGVDDIDFDGSADNDSFLLTGDIPATLSGGDGADTLRGGNGADTLDGGNGFDNIEGGAGNDILNGGAGNDFLLGGDGDDALHGDADADTLKGGLGADDYDGGLGTDTAWLASSDGVHGVVVKIDDLANDGTDTSSATPLGEEHDNVRASNEKIHGSAYADFLQNDNAARTFYGEAGNDRIYGGTANDVLYGGTGDDQLFGGSGNDFLFADAGNDVLQGDKGGDNLDGGSGTDTVVMTSTDGVHGVVVKFDELANDGTDNKNTAVPDAQRNGEEKDNVRSTIEIVKGTNVADVIFGREAYANNDQLFGLGGSDRIYGFGGNDVLDGGTGADRLYGGDGNDTLKAKDATKDIALDGGAGTDTAYLDNGKDVATTVEKKVY